MATKNAENLFHWKAWARRLNKKIIITKMDIFGKDALVMALSENDRIMELQVHPLEESAILGNIYIGKVTKVVPDTKGAFVDIKPGFSTYLAVDDLKSKNIRNGSELLVQVSQEALKTKVPRVTTNLNLTGNYLVVTSEKPGLGISSKIDSNTKKEIKSWLTSLIREEYGVIVRTNAASVEKQIIIEELQNLYQQMDDILNKGETRTCYSLIKKATPFFIDALRHIQPEELEKTITDLPEIYGEILEYWKEQHADLSKITFYQDKLLPLSKLYSLEHIIEEALHQKVWLKNGGFLMIQPTEAFVAIDVNSGKYSSKKNAHEMRQKINHEAAKEIARQLRLRNLYGMILIDFINMERQEDCDELLAYLSKQVKGDSVKTQVIDMTKLQITELTRKKTRKSLSEQVNELRSS